MGGGELEEKWKCGCAGWTVREVATIGYPRIAVLVQ